MDRIHAIWFILENMRFALAVSTAEECSIGDAAVFKGIKYVQAMPPCYIIRASSESDVSAAESGCRVERLAKQVAH